MKFAERIYFLVAFVMLLAAPAYAYIDPSVVSYGAYAIGAVAVAVGTVAGVLWRKAKKKVQDKLGIDENAKKEVEEDIVEYDVEK